MRSIVRLTVVLFAVAGLPGLASAGVSSPVATITDTQQAADYTARLNLIHALPRALSPSDSAALIAFLEDPRDHAEEVEAAVLRNDTVDRLRMSDVPAEDVAAALRRAYQDERHSEIWRTYCLQHLGQFLPQLSWDAGKEACEQLWEAAASENAGFAGTALLGLAARAGHEVDPTRLASAAIRQVADPERHDVVRLSAMQVLHELQDPRVSEIARAILAESDSVPLRLLALTALGGAGDRDDLRLIHPYRDNPIPAFRRTARLANDQLMKRYPSGENVL